MSEVTSYIPILSENPDVGKSTAWVAKMTPAQKDVYRRVCLTVEPEKVLFPEVYVADLTDQILSLYLTEQAIVVESFKEGSFLRVEINPQTGLMAAATQTTYVETEMGDQSLGYEVTSVYNFEAGQVRQHAATPMGTMAHSNFLPVDLKEFMRATGRVRAEIMPIFDGCTVSIPPRKQS